MQRLRNSTSIQKSQGGQRLAHSVSLEKVMDIMTDLETLNPDNYTLNRKP